MQLHALFDSIQNVTGLDERSAQTTVTGITADPNLCKPGYLYVAAESETVDSNNFGLRLDGRDFISVAIKNGAVAVFTTPGVVLDKDIAKAVLIIHEEPLSIFGLICARFFGEPRPQHIVLVTGTNGKTSTVNFSRMLWSANGHPACSIGNLGAFCSDGSLLWESDPTLSIPETVELNRVLSVCGKKDINHVAMEATSHALFDHRVTGIGANIGAFTNLTRDHLDFHGTMEEYFRVKMTLFNNVLPPGSGAVLNADTEWYEQAAEICRQRNHKVISYGLNGKEIKLISSEQIETGQLLKLQVFGKGYECKLSLYGHFQVSNALCSLGIVILSGVPADDAVAQIETLTPVNGRLDLIGHAPSGGKIIIDFAHTPDGIKAVLDASRTFTRGNLWIIFSCDGERDFGKRAQMGEVATQLADRIIITDGHPRSEDAAAIRSHIMVGAPDAREIANRADAIEYGINSLGADDTLVIAGKGPKTFEIGSTGVISTDTEIAKKVLGRLIEGAKVAD